MDGGERRPSQYGTPYQTPGTGRPAPGQPMGPPAHDRFSQTGQSPVRTDISRSTIARPYMPGYPYNYSQHESQYHSQQSSPMSGVEMHYTPPYIQDPSRQQQVQQSPSQHQYSTFQGNMLPPVAQQQMYESMPPYQQQRQSAAIEVMASQFGGLPQYMPHGEQGSVGLPSSSAQFMATQPEQQSYGAMTMSRPGLQAPFSATTSDFPVLENPDPQEQPEEANTVEALEEGRRDYEQQLRATFDAISAGRVSEASEKLMHVSRWLLGSVRVLGLYHSSNSARPLLTITQDSIMTTRGNMSSV